MNYFDETSQVVRAWVSLIENENSGFGKEDVPKLFNLREVVYRVLDEKERKEND